MQANSASRAAAPLLRQAPAAVAASPFAQCSSVPHELQSLCAELKTENACLRAEVAELQSTASSRGIPSGHAFPGTFADVWQICTQCRNFCLVSLLQTMRYPDRRHCRPHTAHAKCDLGTSCCGFQDCHQFLTEEFLRVHMLCNWIGN